MIKELENEGINAFNSYQTYNLQWPEGKSYVLGDIDYTELFINENIDSYLIAMINRADEYSVDQSNIIINIKYESVWENNFISKNSKYNMQWILEYTLYNQHGESLGDMKIYITKDQATRFLNNIVYLNLEEN